MMKRPYWICSWRMAPWCLLDILGTWLVKRHGAALQYRFRACGFYEDDEPIEDVKAAFDAGDKGITERPVTLTAPGLRTSCDQVLPGQTYKMVDPYVKAAEYRANTTTGTPVTVQWRTT